MKSNNTEMMNDSAIKYYEILLRGVEKPEWIDGKMVWVVHYDGKRYIKHDMRQKKKPTFR